MTEKQSPVLAHVDLIITLQTCIDWFLQDGIFSPLPAKRAKTKQKIL
jgi:hypothetical protein